MGDKLESQALAEQILSKAIQNVVFNYNAFAPIISSFRIAYTDSIPTMGVDKYARLIANPKFVVDNEVYMQAIIIHEVLHVFFGHTTDDRSKLAYTDDQQMNFLINLAEDCAINQFIDRSCDVELKMPEGAITPYTLSEMLNCHVPPDLSAEEYLDIILAHKQNAPQINVMCAAGDVNTGSMQDELGKMGIPHLSQEEVSEKRLETAVEVSKGQGNKYGMLQDFARELMEPKVDWRPLLQATIRNAEKKVWTAHTHSTFKRTSRRSTTFLMPKKYGHKLSISLSFDTSGSISADMVNQFLAEIEGCLRYSDVKECALWHTSVYWYGTPTQLKQDVEKVFQSGGTYESSMSEAERHCKADIHFHFSDGEHGNNYGFKEPHKNIEIIWQNDEIKEIRKEF